MSEFLIKIIRNGEIIIPKPIREKYGLKEGDRLILYDKDNHMVLRKAKITVE